MKTKLIPLMQREWLQHRFGWALLTLLPLVLALLLTGYGQVELGAAGERVGAAMPALLAMGSICGTAALLFAVLSLSSGIIVSGLARRDHGDRSIEFWLSLPASHVQSLAAPMLVHLLLVPAAALLAGLVGGYAVSLVLVTRAAGVATWFGLPWGDISAAALALTGRVLVGLPLATLWLSPLILLVVLLTAWFKRWGWVILAVGVGFGSIVLKKVFGAPLLAEVIAALLEHARQALFFGGHANVKITTASQAVDTLQLAPAWAVEDFGFALRDLASPLLLGALLFSAACFALLVQWRQRGAGAAS